jgi:glycosyltransferase involved in cell wall biosynthesis
MRILHIIDDLQRGGAERSLVSLIGALPQHQHRVVYFLARAAYAPVLSALGADLEHLPVAGIGDVPRTVARLRELAEEADVVHTQRWMADLIGRAAVRGRTAIVTTVQISPYEPWAFQNYSWRGQALYGALWLGDIVLSSRATDRMVGVCDYVKRLIVERLRVPAARVRRVYNSIPVEEFGNVPPAERSETRRQLGLADDDVAIASVGHVVPLKGQALLVEALPRVVARAPKAVLLIIGEGAQRATLERRAAELGVAERIRWLGLRDDVPRLLGAVDLFAHASHGEGFPLCVLEAMASSLPCTLSAIAPHRELATIAREHSGHGPLVVEEQDAGAWADALTSLVLDGEARARIGEEARGVVAAHFDARVTAPGMAAVFAEAADQFRS